MGTPKDWLRESRGIGTFAPAPLGGQPTGVIDDPMVEVERMQARQRAAMEMNAALEDAEEERELRKMQKQMRMLTLTKQIEQLTGGGQQGAAQAEIFRDALQSMQQQQEHLLAELRQARNENANAANRAVLDQLSAMQSRIEALSQARPHDSDPIGNLVKNLRAVHDVRNALDDALPVPAHVAEASSARERLEELRMDKEYQLRKMEVDAQLESARAAREAAQADRAMKQHRMERASSLVENTLGPVLAQIGGEKVAGLFGGGAEGAAASTAQSPAMLPFTCPNPQCNMVGHVPEGTMSTTCEHCGATFGLYPAGETPPEDAGALPGVDDTRPVWNEIQP